MCGGIAASRRWISGRSCRHNTGFAGIVCDGVFALGGNVWVAAGLMPLWALSALTNRSHQRRRRPVIRNFDQEFYRRFDAARSNGSCRHQSPFPGQIGSVSKYGARTRG